MEGDEALVERARQGCEDALAALIERHRRLVLGVLWSQLQDLDDAQDAAQETWVLAVRHLPELRERARFQAWVCALARNTGYKWLGQRALRQQRHARLEEMAAAAAPPQEQPTREALRAALGVLSSAERMTVTLHYLVGLDQSRVADVLGIPVGTIKSRLHRARRLLKRRLLEMTEENLVGSDPGEDYGRAVIAGMRGVIHWRRLLESEGLAGWHSRNPMRREGERLAQVWQRSGEAIIGADLDGEGERLFVGDAAWQDYEFSVLVTPIEGGNAQVQFRLSEDGSRFYSLDLLMGWQALALLKVDLRPGQGAPCKISVVNLPLQHSREYDVLIAAREASLTTYIDGKLANQVTDYDFRSGPAALSVWRSRTAFRDPRVRHLH